MLSGIRNQIKGLIGLKRSFDHVDIVHQANAELGEGCLWDDRDQVLWWVDIQQGILHRHDPATGENIEYEIKSPIGTVGLRESGGLILATANGLTFFDPETEQLEPIVDPESHLKGNRFNDGKPGPNGSFYVGSMGYYAEAEVGSLYKLDTEKKVEKILDDVTISNGLAWNAAEDTMFYIDTTTKGVDAFDYDKSTGAIANRRTVVKIPFWGGGPDGMTIDNKGMLWVAHFGGHAVHRWDPSSGQHLETVPLPASNITCCTFGGPNFDTLYITSAKVGLTRKRLAKQPLAGALFKVKVGQSGRPAYRFKG